MHEIFVGRKLEKTTIEWLKVLKQFLYIHKKNYTFQKWRTLYHN